MNVNGLVPSVFNELIILGTNFIAPLAFYVTPLSTTVINGDIDKPAKKPTPASKIIL